MCRHIGYIGKKKDLYSILLKHDHSLIDLAYKPKLMKEATLNADGFGLAWLSKQNFMLYKNYLPIWNDLNLDNKHEFINVKFKNFDHFPVPRVIEKFLKNFYDEQKK